VVPAYLEYALDEVRSGHGATANRDQLVFRVALEYTYFARRLMVPAGGVPEQATPRS
jgi:hypothetical protein